VVLGSHPEFKELAVLGSPGHGGASVAAQQVCGEGGAMPGQSNEEAVGAHDCAGGRRGCRQRRGAASFTRGATRWGRKRDTRQEDRFFF
jgi:hypothetical protein